MEILSNLNTENIIIPLSKHDRARPLLNLSSFNDDKFKLIDYKFLDGINLSKYMNINNPTCGSVLIPYAGDVCCAVGSEDCIPIISKVETYSSILNLSFLCTEESANNFIYGNNIVDNDNIATKKVQDCNISELLFAIQQKLKGK